MPRVIFAEPNQRYTISGAKAHGEIEFITPDRLDVHDFENNFALMSRRLVAMGFDSEVDMVCLTGQQLIVSTLMAATIDSFPNCKFLIFDSKLDKYVVRDFSKPGALGRAYGRGGR